MTSLGVVDEVRLYRRVVGARIRSDWQYRTSFLLMLLSQSLLVAAELAALLVMVGLVDGFGGWTRAEVVFLYALASLPFSIGDLFISEVERLANSYVRNGAFDTVLLRPSSPLLQVVALEFELRKAGKLVPPLLALVWSMAALDVGWTPLRVAGLVVALASGTVIYGALWVVAGTIPFWAVQSREATNALTYGGYAANQYPLHIYPGWIRAVLGWLVPLAFVAYVPTVFLVEADNALGLPGWMVAGPPVAAVAVAVVAWRVWRTGVRHYQSTGN